MQKTTEEHQTKTPLVRVVAGFLGLQGVIALITTLVSLISNPSRILSADFLSLNVSIFLLLLSWGLWTFKRWAYWVTLLVEGLVLIQGVVIVLLPPGPFKIGAAEGLALISILLLVLSPNARAAFFQKNKKQLPENERKGLSTHLFE